MKIDKFMLLSGTMGVLAVLTFGRALIGAEQPSAKPAGAKAADKGVLHTVDASVTYSAGTNAGTNVLAQRQPGHFTVRPGEVARDFTYSFVDPKTGIELNRLNDHTIYCVTTKRWVKVPKDPKTLELSPGEYEFVVGGLPGASGTLNFRTIARDVSTTTTDSVGAPKPPSGTPHQDTAKTKNKTGALHPGGEGRNKDSDNRSQRVSIHWKGLRTTGETDAPFDGTTPARLTVVGERFELHFVLELPRSETTTAERATIRWEGSIARENGVRNVNGTTREDHTWTDKWGGQGFSRGNGTFEGRLTGNTWRGSMEERGETKASQQDKAESYRIKAEWSIDITPDDSAATSALPDGTSKKPE